MPYSLKKKLLRLCALGFCNQVKNFATNNLLQVGELVTYWDPCNKKGGVHILKSSEVQKR